MTPPPEELMTERGPLLNLAYRMLGSYADAEDAVQETFARWFALDDVERAAVEVPAAWLRTVASRICLDVLGSARVRREQYVGEWVPEPVPDPTEWAAADPADRITLDESVDMAFLVVLDAMTPGERVSFLLHDVFCYPFDEVAQIVGRTPAACRQLASSARRRVEGARPMSSPSAQRAAVVRSFKEAWRAKDVAALVGLLDPSAVAVADGGGRATAALDPIEGAERIAAYLVTIASLAGTMDLEEHAVNGQPGLVGRHDGEIVTVYAFEVGDERIRRFWAVRNPDKLRSWRER